ncbi:Zinc cluster transcription factor 08 [Pleurotus pulmonarius]
MPPSDDKSSSLRRGTACLCCRKKKLKCDGVRPVCKQCSKMGRDELCEYDDKRQKSRTQKLKEKLQFLECRLRELENQRDPSSFSSTSATSTQHPTPNSEPPSSDHVVAVADPSHGNQIGDFSVASGRELSELTGDPTEQCHLPLDGIILPQDAAVFDRILEEVTPQWLPVNTSFQDDISTSAGGARPHSLTTGFDDLALAIDNLTPSNNEIHPQDLPFDVKTTLINAFLAHRHQCWFDGNVTKVLTISLDCSEPEPFHPALVNAIYLLGCHFSSSLGLDTWEEAFFRKTISNINTALELSDRLVDIVQASSLLGSYLYAKGRNLEAYGHAYAACRLAVGLGLHRLRATDISLTVDESSSTGTPTMTTQLREDPPSIPINPPSDVAEWRERVSAFWQAFSIDRCWSTALGLPTALPHGTTPKDKLITPWLSPTTREGGLSDTTIAPVGRFDPLPKSTHFGVQTSALTLRVKSVALYERAHHLAGYAPEYRNGNKFLTDLQALTTSFQAFTAAIPPFLGTEPYRSQHPLVDAELLFVHTLIHVTSIHIVEAYTPETAPAREEQIILGAISKSSFLIEALSDSDFEFLDPFISVCWYHLAKVVRAKISDKTTCWLMLNTLTQALTKLGHYFPVARDYLHKIGPQ